MKISIEVDKKKNLQVKCSAIQILNLASNNINVDAFSKLVDDIIPPFFPHLNHLNLKDNMVNSKGVKEDADYERKVKAWKVETTTSLVKANDINYIVTL